MEKPERLFGLRSPERSPRFWLVLAFLFGAALLLSIVSLVAFGGVGYGWNQVVFPLAFAAWFVISVGEALFAGAFEGRFVERGRALRLVGSLGLALALLVFAVASGYRMGGVVGAILGGVVAVALYLLPALFYRRSP